MTSGTKDRLHELLSQTNRNGENVQTDEVQPENEIPVPFQQVFDQVYNVRNMIDDIKRNTRRIKEIAQTGFTSKGITEIESIVKASYDTAFKVTEILKELDVKITKKSNDGEKSTLFRMKRLQYASLRQDLQNALFENNQFLEEFHERKRVLLKKQAMLVNSNLQEDELERLLDNPEQVQLFTDNILLETKIAKDQLNQIEERHAELLKIENLLTDVNNQFKHIAILVEQQKEHINRIEFHACDAINYVDKGLLDIQKAEKNKRKARKKIYYIAIFVTIIIIIVVLAFVI